MIRDIAGRHNHSVKLAHKLQKKKHRRERGLLVAEGMDLLAAAFENGADVREVLVREDLVETLPPGLLDAAGRDRFDIGVCTQEVLESASSLGGASDVVFVCRTPSWSLGDLDLRSGVAMFLQEVGDPGNVGTLVRSAAAFGAVGLLCSPGSADPYGPKAMRAGMGSQFVVPVVAEVSADDLAAHVAALSGSGTVGPTVVVADSRTGDDVRRVDVRAGVVLVLGAERRGPGTMWESHPRVRIVQDRIDSLNVAMAGTILMYEVHTARGGNE